MLDGSFKVSECGTMDHESYGHGSKRGGLITFPFITGAVLGMSLASTGMMENVIVYLIKEYNIKSIDAAQASNIVNGCTSVSPVVAAILADSFFGSFMVASISSLVSLLGTFILTLSAALKSLRPQPCEVGSCKSPSGLQYSVLYIGLALTTIGFGGTRFILATLGANQYDKQTHQSVFFNWFFFTLHVGSIISMTAIFYVESDISWSLGFGLCLVATFIATIILVLGFRFYRPEKLQGSPFVDLARVLVASIRKWKDKFDFSTTSVKDYYGGDTLPTTRLRFFNRAALIIGGDLDIDLDGKIAAKPWSICKVQQVEDFKTLIGILPLWTTSIFLTIPLTILQSLEVLQALAMDRHIGSHFMLPPASIPVITLISTSITLTLLDRLVYPTWHKLIGKPPTALHQIGVGHVFSVLGLAVAAVVESKRLKQVDNNNNNMSVFWLCPQLVLVGVGVAFHFPGQVGFYYQEFPESLRSTSTAMISLVLAVGNYLSTALIGVVRRNTKWLPNDINEGRLDNMYWLLMVIGGINIGYYLVCATLYKYRNQV